MAASAASTAGYVALQASPIILTGGIATQLGGALPIVALTEAGGLLGSALSGASALSEILAGAALVSQIFANGLPKTLFANFIVLPGAGLINNQFGMYPFANQAVAANAVIAEPLPVSVLMQVPATKDTGFALKLATMTALQNSLQQHNFSGGTYSVVTPSYIYTNCLLGPLTDASAGDDTQQQVSWRFDFTQPLVTTAAASQAQNTLMRQLTNGSPISGISVYPGGLPVGNPSTVPSNLVPSLS
jgi:hypothetical protein